MPGPTSAAFDAVAYLALAVLVLCCLAAARLDLRERRIPNWLCLVTALLGLGAAVVLVPSWGNVGSHALHMTVALLGGMALFALKIFGGGDAKFYAAVATWFPFGMGALLLIAVALSGLVLLIVWFTWRRLRGLPIRKPHGANFESLPYGIAIGAGAVVTVMLGWAQA